MPSWLAAAFVAAASYVAYRAGRRRAPAVPALSQTPGPQPEELERAQLAAQVAELLSGPDAEGVLPDFARRLVPRFGAWCAVDLVDESGQLRRAAEAGPAAERELYAAIDRAYAALPGSPSWGYRHVRETGAGEILAPGTAGIAALEQTEDLVRGLGCLSGVSVPIDGRSGPLGVLTVLRTDVPSPAADLETLRELGRRAGVAIANGRALREAQAASRLKDEFLAVVSHELRTPLAGILIWSQLLRAGDLDGPGTQRALDMIERGAKSLEQIIEDLIDVSRVMTGRLKLELAPVDLASLVQQAVEAARPQADAEGIRLAFLPTGTASVTGDFVRLQQVMNNLLANAIKFTTAGGRVQVLLDRVDGDARIRVVDTGGGIDPQQLPYVFDRYWQAESGTTRRQGGLGLGLAIVRHIVQLHRGRVRAESAGEGQGATLEILLPVAAATPTVAAPASEAPPRAQRIDGLRILMVEDDTDTREALKLVLEKSGAQVAAMGSGREALAAIEGVRPDIMLCDIAMPEEDGYAVIAKVRALGPARSGDVPAVAVTAYASPEDRARALSAGFQAHVAKPVEPARLIALIDSLAHVPRSA